MDAPSIRSTVADSVSPRVSTFLNASRWVAAFLVAAHHVRHLVIVDAAKIVVRSPFLKAFYFTTGLGGDAVMVFFVVSGYLVGGRAVVSYSSRGFDIGDYAVHRTSRIYVVLLPALVVGGLLDTIGLHAFDRSGIYANGAHHDSLRTLMAITNNLNVTTFVGNLFLLENIAVPRFGTNNPLWSLTYEWWYYGMFAALMLAFTPRAMTTRAIAAIALVAMIVFLPYQLVCFATIWIIGAATAAYARMPYWKPMPWMGVSVLGCVLVLLRLTEHASTVTHEDTFANLGRAGAVAVGYALLLLSYHRPGSDLPFARLHERLARFSYTLYLVHYPMIVFCVCFLNTTLGVGFLRSPDAMSLAYFMCLLVFVVAYGFGFAELTERHTGRLRKMLLATFRREART